MKIQNLGLQESIGAKYVNVCLKATGIFVILLSQSDFKCDPETKFQRMNHFIKSVQKKTHTNTLQNICSL